MHSRQGSPSTGSTSEIPLVLSSFSLRLTASSEYMMVSGEGKGDSHLWLPSRDLSADFHFCLIGEDPGHMPIPKSITGKGNGALRIGLMLQANQLG